MPKETFVKVIYQDLSEIKNNNAQFEYKINLPNDTKECIVRQITYKADNSLTEIANCMIRCSLINDYIASFVVEDGQQSFYSTPNTILTLQQPKTDRIIFSIESPYDKPAVNIKGELCIVLEFHK